MTLNSKTLIFAAVLCLTAAFGAVAPAYADQIKVKSEYNIAFAGIPVARSQFETIIDGTALSVSGTLKTAGLAAVFDSTMATSVSSGLITEAGVETQLFNLDYKSGKRSRSTQVRFSGGNVVETAITPKREPNPNNVPIEAGQLNGVVDPFFASLVVASNPADVCNRTIKVFDGVLRINLVLRPSGSEPYVVGKSKGDGIRCAARYQPVAGHRAKSSSVSYLADGERATIVFGALPGTNLYGPVKASIKTKSGTVTIRATKFEQTGK